MSSPQRQTRQAAGQFTFCSGKVLSDTDSSPREEDSNVKLSSYTLSRAALEYSSWKVGQVKLIDCF